MGRESSSIKRRRVLKAAPAFAGLVAGCTGGGSESTQTPEPTATMEPGSTQTTTPDYEAAIAKLEAQAKEEGLLYVRRTPHSTLEAIMGNRIAERLGIEYQDAGFATQKNISQSLTEMRAGKLQADIISTTKPTEQILMMNNQMCKTGITPPAVEYGKATDEFMAQWDDDRRWFNVTLSGRAVGYNTDVVDEPPQTLEELLDPKWESSVLIDTDHVMNLTVAMDILGSWESGVQWLKDFKPQIKRLVTSSYSATVNLGQGRAKFLMNAPIALLREQRELEGLPIDWVWINDTMPATYPAYSILKEAPHPAAAELFLNEATKDEVQEEIINTNFDYSIKRDLWPDRLKNFIDDGGRISIFNVPFALEAQRKSGLTLNEMLTEYKRIIGAE